MAYKVVVTNDAKENMQEYIEYILYEKKNQQAAGSLLDAYEFAKGNINLIWPYKFNSKWQCTHVTLSVILMCN